MFGVEQLQSRLSSIVREGTVSAVYVERHSCRVTFEDRGGLVSAEMPVLTLFASKNKSYALPDIGERVVVIMSSNDLSAGGGYVIGSLYTGATPPTARNGDITRLEFADKTYLEYDRKAHTFKIQFNEKSYITFDGENSELEINCKGNILITGDKRLEISMKDMIDVETRKDIELSGKNIRLN